jgi:hypothetical protein
VCNRTVLVMNQTQASIVALVSVTLLLAAATASAEDGTHEIGTHETGTHDAAYSNTIGVKAVNLNAVHDAEPAEGEEHAVEEAETETEISPHFGVALFYERAILHHLVELELNGMFVNLDDGFTVPVEGVVKLVLGDSQGTVVPFIGVGPGVQFVRAEHNETFFQVVAVAGAYVWFTDQVGLDIELDYGMVFEEHIVHEFGPSIGPVFRF